MPHREPNPLVTGPATGQPSCPFDGGGADPVEELDALAFCAAAIVAASAALCAVEPLCLGQERGAILADARERAGFGVLRRRRARRGSRARGRAPHAALRCGRRSLPPSEQRLAAPARSPPETGRAPSGSDRVPTRSARPGGRSDSGGRGCREGLRTSGCRVRRRSGPAIPPRTSRGLGARARRVHVAYCRWRIPRRAVSSAIFCRSAASRERSAARAASSLASRARSTATADSAARTREVRPLSSVVSTPAVPAARSARVFRSPIRASSRALSVPGSPAADPARSNVVAHAAARAVHRAIGGLSLPSPPRPSPGRDPARGAPLQPHGAAARPKRGSRRR